MKISFIKRFALMIPVVIGAFLLTAVVANAQSTTTATTTASTTSPTLTTVLSSSTVSVNASVIDTATLSGTTANAAGTVAYVVYDDSACSVPVVGAGVVNVTNGIVPNSIGITFPAAGTYFWRATYSGDTGNGAATSSCLMLTINSSSTGTTTGTTTPATTTISTALSSSSVLVNSSVYATSTLSGATANAAGTVAYVVHGDSTCSASSALVGAGEVNVANGIVPNSIGITFPATGTFYWQSHYSGDASNSPATSTCVSLLVSAATSTGTSTNNGGNNGGGNGTTTGTTTATTTSGLGSISGVVYNDYNQNGVKDPEESLLPGWIINLYQGAGFSGPLNKAPMKSFSTDANGAYSFTGLAAGTYSVEEVNQPGGLEQFTSDYDNVVIASGTALTGYDFANIISSSSTSTPGTTTPEGSISGVVYNDLNRSGEWDEGEPLLPGWTINLYEGSGWSGPDNKSPLMSVVSDANGNYEFNGLANGTYSVEEINQASLNQYTSDFESVDVSGAAVTDMNFGNVAGDPYDTYDNQDQHHRWDHRHDMNATSEESSTTMEESSTTSDQSSTTVEESNNTSDQEDTSVTAPSDEESVNEQADENSEEVTPPADENPSVTVDDNGNHNGWSHGRGNWRHDR